MYVTTFYSFKGGVGRTMALANVAVALAQRGRRVLVVDFDLEAPGLDAFDLRRPASTTPGVIDFVNAYLRTGQAPHVSDFVYESQGIAAPKGGLWIMPAGAHNDGYATTLAHIDWGALYEHHDGYLLFEDLKEQWNAFIEPDYVLIDSRTGHTDIAGICTRQLPHAVVVLFFPNAQNLRGLTKIVRDIRAETRRPRSEAIDLHFVMSNVPDLDDEDKILEENITAFQRDLGFQKDPLVIHRYDSLSLLNQVIFVKERPRSRLAKEYHNVTGAIMRLNAEDRDGALDYIARIHQIWRAPGSPVFSLASAETHIQTIEKNHSDDGEILFRLGSLRADDGSMDDAVALFRRAIDAGYREPEVYLRRGSITRSEYGDPAGASHDAMEALSSEHASPAQVRRAIAMVTPQRLTEVPETPAVSALPPSELVWVASELEESEVEAVTASNILRPLLMDSRLSPDDQKNARHSLSLAAIAQGRFSEAIQVILDEEPNIDQMTIEFAFNYGMAMWAQAGRVIDPPFQHVVEIEQSDPRQAPWPNYLQCMAISHWAVRQVSAAREYAEKAREEMAARGGREFSCWRYLRVNAKQFEEDTNEVLQLVDGDETVTPRFMAREERQRSLFPDRGLTR